MAFIQRVNSVGSLSLMIVAMGKKLTDIANRLEEGSSLMLGAFREHINGSYIESRDLFFGTMGKVLEIAMESGTKKQ